MNSLLVFIACMVMCIMFKVCAVDARLKEVCDELCDREDEDCGNEGEEGAV